MNHKQLNGSFGKFLLRLNYKKPWEVYLYFRQIYLISYTFFNIKSWSITITTVSLWKCNSTMFTKKIHFFLMKGSLQNLSTLTFDFYHYADNIRHKFLALCFRNYLLICLELLGFFFQILYPIHSYIWHVFPPCYIFLVYNPNIPTTLFFYFK
jgi:hypothetical protein